MASEQSMTQAIMQAVIEVTKPVTMAVRETEIPMNTTKPEPTVTKTDGPVLN